MNKTFFIAVTCALGLTSPAGAAEPSKPFWKAIDTLKAAITRDSSRFDADVWERNRFLDERGIEVTQRNLTDMSIRAGEASEISLGRDGVRFLRRF